MTRTFDMWKHIHEILSLFSSDNYLLIAVAMVIVSTLCIVLFWRAPVWPRICALMISSSLILGAAVIVFHSPVAPVAAKANFEKTIVKSGFVKNLTPIEGRHTCAVIDECSGEIACWGEVFPFVYPAAGGGDN